MTDFAALLEAERPRLVRRGVAFWNLDVSTAEDLAQDAIVRAWRARRRFDGRDLGAWLRTIHRGILLTHATSADVRYTRTRDNDAMDSRPARATSATSDPLEDVDDRLRRGIAACSRTYRKPFLLFALGGLSYDEIAARLRVPPGTVMSRVHRARQRILEVLGPNYLRASA